MKIDCETGAWGGGEDYSLMENMCVYLGADDVRTCYINLAYWSLIISLVCGMALLRA